MSRLWLAAVGTAAVIACGDAGSSGEPNELFPDVAGTYIIEGDFDNENATFTGSVVLEQESRESSLLSGRATITLFSSGSSIVISTTELQDATVNLAGVVDFTVVDDGVTWSFTGERAGDVISGTHTLTQGAESRSGTWSGER